MFLMLMHTYEYIWLGGNDEFRGITRVLDTVLTIEEVSLWNYEVSSTKQTEGHDSEVILHKDISKIEDLLQI